MRLLELLGVDHALHDQYLADQLAAAADLTRRKDSRQPVVLVRGAEAFVTDDDGPGAAALIRPEQDDLFS